MTKLSLIFGFSALAFIFIMGSYPGSAGPLSGIEAAQQSGQSVLMKIKKDKKNKPLNCKKAKCATDEIKLDKPNVYGACCQAKGSVTPAPAQKCKFPGEVGPNCDCPQYTEFLGYKGCVPFKWNCVAPGVLDYTMYAANEDEARGKFLARIEQEKYALNNTKVTCKKVYLPN
jgi:hypothetical protein